MFLFTSCQSAKELHYFKEGNNFYRLKVRELAFLSSSRYISGYFDEDAVDNYFGELTRPDSAKLGNSVRPISATDNTSPNNTKLVLILSTNSDIVATQIGVLAQNDQTLELIARLTNKDVIEKNKLLKFELERIDNSKNNVIAYGEKFISTLDTNQLITDRTYGEKRLLLFLNYVATDAGYNGTFNNLNEAELWFKGKYSY